MKFMILGLAPRSEWPALSADQQHQRIREHQREIAALVAKRGTSGNGALVLSVGLQTAMQSSAVRNQGGRHVSVDGPFAETKEVLGGFEIVEFDSDEDAANYAKALANHEGQAYEIRPVVDFWWIQHSTALPAQVFMISMFEDEKASARRSRAERETLINEHESVANEYLAARGTIGDRPALWAGSRLDWSRTAKTVRIAAGNRTLTDGPFAETKELLGGVTLLACDSSDEARNYACKLARCEGDIASVTPIGSFWWIYHG